MQKPADKGVQPPPPPNAEREARLAAALRENLKRRKAQIRGRREAEPDALPVEGTRPDPQPSS